MKTGRSCKDVLIYVGLILVSPCILAFLLHSCSTNRNRKCTCLVAVILRRTDSDAVVQYDQRGNVAYLVFAPNGKANLPLLYYSWLHFVYCCLSFRFKRTVQYRYKTVPVPFVFVGNCGNKKGNSFSSIHCLTENQSRIICNLKIRRL